jgi:ATP-dependent DNA ligase
MSLPIQSPILPMLAKRIEKIPVGAEWIYEPKWDGFRTIIFRDGDDLLIQSRDQKSLNRYFPELIAPLLKQLPQKCVVDGEIVIARGGALDFDALQLRIHPAASRVERLSRQTPASVVLFDLLAKGDRDFRAESFAHRRKALESMLARAKPPLYITPATGDSAIARNWFRHFEGAGFDGVMAKSKDGLYESDKRTMFKIKHERECDCVVAGFRWYRKSDPPAVGSVLLGLYDDDGVLQHVGVCGSFSLKTRHELVNYLKPYRKNAAAHHPWMTPAGSSRGGQSKTLAKTLAKTPARIPGGPSRWNQGKDLSWEPLRLELVAEVSYDHMQGGRFRHMAQFRRWRPDKKPRNCTYDQLEVAPPEELKAIFSR